MSQLELIVMSSKMSPEEARALLDAYVLDDLDADQRRAVDEVLAADAQLSAELEQMRATLEALERLAAPDAPVHVDGPDPADMVARVRGALAAEKRQELEAEAVSANGAEVPFSPPRASRSLWLEIGVATAAACALVVGIAVAGPGFGTDEGAPSGAVGAAGLGATSVVQTELVVVGLDSAAVSALAQELELSADSPDGMAFTGTWRAATRFRLALLERALAAGGGVEGMIPDGEQVEVRISLRSR